LSAFAFVTPTTERRPILPHAVSDVTDAGLTGAPAPAGGAYVTVFAGPSPPACGPFG